MSGIEWEMSRYAQPGTKEAKREIIWRKIKNSLTANPGTGGWYTKSSDIKKLEKELIETYK